MKRIKITDLKKYLQNKSDKELIDEIVELFKMNKQIQELYSLKVNPENEQTLLEEYMDKIEEQFFPDRGFNIPNFGVLKKIVADFKKVAIKQRNVIELLLHYAENSVDFTNSFGDIDEKFYNHIINIYQEALDLIVENNLEEVYFSKCQAIMKDSKDIGWGFGDWMNELFYDYLGECILNKPDSV